MRKMRLALVVALAGCASQPVPSGSHAHPIGGGVQIALPSGWKVQSFPMPMEGATNIRATSGSVKVAITGIPTGQPAQEGGVLEGQVTEIKQRYWGAKTQPAPPTLSFTTERVNGAYAELCSPGGAKEFNVLPGPAFECVTPAILSANGMVFSVSIASDSHGSAEYQEALAAVKGAH